jgi:hypothetical protein
MKNKLTLFGCSLTFLTNEKQLTWVRLSPTSAVQENPLRSVCSHPGAAVTAITVTITVTMPIICIAIMALAIMATGFGKNILE